MSLNLKSNNNNLTLVLNQFQHSPKEQKQDCNTLSKHKGFSYCTGWISIAAPVKGSMQTHLSVDEITPTLSLSLAWGECKEHDSSIIKNKPWDLLTFCAHLRVNSFITTRLKRKWGQEVTWRRREHRTETEVFLFKETC